MVCKVYTEAFGMQSYMVNGVRGPRPRAGRGSLLQPLSLLQMVVYQREHKNLQRIKEFSPDRIYQKIPSDIKRGTIGLFITEVINKSVIEETENEDLFEFLYDSLLALDTCSPVANFHLYFLLELSQHLGFYPQRGQPDYEHYFDMNEGAFVNERPVHPNIVEPQPASLMLALMDATNVEGALKIKTNYQVRKVVLGDLLRYFEMHLDHFKNIRSHLILDAVFRN